VVFEIDGNGILSVSATDKFTGKRTHVTIKASGGLSEDEINNMIEDAETYKEEDKKIRKITQIKNYAQMELDQIKRLTEEEQKQIKDKATDLKNILETDDINAIEEKARVLSEQITKIGFDRAAMTDAELEELVFSDLSIDEKISRNKTEIKALENKYGRNVRARRALNKAIQGGGYVNNVYQYFEE
jgi:molecular chaperone DnaK